MSKPLLDILRLNQERYGMDFEFSAAWAKLSEELDEFTEAHSTNDQLEMVDALNDIITIAAGEIAKLGFNPELTLKQCVKHVSVRKQDPEQALRWLHNDRAPGEKWQKDVNQDPSTLHTADYNLCKLASK